MMASPQLVRQARMVEHYAITCTCSAEFETPAAPIDAKGGKTHCIRCGATLRIEWRPESPTA